MIGRPLTERLQLLPRTGNDTASGYFLLPCCSTIPPTATETDVAREIHSDRKLQVCTQAIAKPATHGLNGRHQQKSSGRHLEPDIESLGIRRETEWQGEHLAYFLQLTLKLPCKIPETCAAILSHRLFTAPEPILHKLYDQLGLRFTFKELLSLSQPTSSVSSFPGADEENSIFHEMIKTKIANTVLENLKARGVQPRGSEILFIQNTIKAIISTPSINSFLDNLSPRCQIPIADTVISPRQDLLQITNAIRGSLLGGSIAQKDGVLIHHEPHSPRFAKALPWLLRALADTDSSEGKRLARLGEETRLASCTQTFFRPSVCSLQHWVDQGTLMSDLTKEERMKITPWAIARLAIIDSCTGNMDREQANILTVRRSFGEVQKEIDSTAQRRFLGLLESVEWQLGKRKNTLPHDASYVDKVRLAEDCAEAGIKQWNHSNIERAVSSEFLDIEFAVYNWAWMCVTNEPYIVDCVPIDNAMSFVDPELGDEKGTCLQAGANNGWALTPQALAGKIPAVTRRYLSNLDLEKNGLRELQQEHRQLLIIAERVQLPETAHMEERQWSYLLLLNHLTRKLMERNVPIAVFGFIKDSLRIKVEGSNEDAVTYTPGPKLQHWYDKFIRGRSVEELDFDGFEAVIEEALKELYMHTGDPTTGLEKVIRNQQIERNWEQTATKSSAES